MALLLSGLATYASLVAADAPKPASPSEINAGLGLVGTGFVLSPDGRWLAFSTTKGQGYVDLTTGKLANVKSGWSLSGSTPYASWSPLNNTLAFQARREGKMALTLWPAGVDAQSPEVRELLVFPRKLYPKMPPIWAQDGKTIYFVINQNLPWPKSSPQDDNPPTKDNNVTLELAGAYKKDPERRRFEKEYTDAYAETNRSLIMAMDVASGKTGVLAKGNDIDSLYLSPDGAHLVAVQIKRNSNKELSGEWARQWLADLYMIETAKIEELPTIDLEKMEDRKAGWSDRTGQRLTPVMTDVGMNSTAQFTPPFSEGTNANPQLVWAPDSTRFAYATVGKQSTGDLYVYDLAAKQARDLTDKVALKPTPKQLGYGENLMHAYDSQKFGFLFNPMWMPDGKALVVVGRGDVWLVPLDPAAAPKNLTEKFRQEVVRIVPSVNLAVALVDDRGQLTLLAKSRNSRMDSVWKLDPAFSQATQVAGTGMWTGLTIGTDRDGANLVYTGQSITSAKNIYRIGLKDSPGTGAAATVTKAELVTKFRLQLAERSYPESRVLSWKTPDGYNGFGLLYLPPGASKEKKAALIFDGYPSQDFSEVDVRAKAGAGFYSESLQGLLQEGFAVLFADIPMSDSGVYEHPMKQMVDAVNAAVDATLATGLIDEKRMGLMGTSYGAIMVNAVITQTNRFKAAASISGLSDWFADYMGGGDVSGFYHEYGQGRFVKQLWGDPERYVENSPITYWDKVNTPLLIVHGEFDSRVPIRHAWESFNGLNHLKKTVIFANYPRMGHGANPEASQRIRGWFREQILGGKPITQIADQGSFFFGGSEAEDAPVGPSVPGPAPTTPAPPPNTPPAPTLPTPQQPPSGN